MSIKQELQYIKTATSDVRSFGWTVGGAFLALWLAFIGPVHYFSDYIKGGHYPALMWIGIVLVVLGTVAPVILRPVYLLWMTMAVALGFVMTRVILTIFYYLVLTPTGMIFRILGKDLLDRKVDREGRKSYWIEKEYLIEDRSRYENFF